MTLAELIAERRAKSRAGARPKCSRRGDRTALGRFPHLKPTACLLLVVQRTKQAWRPRHSPTILDG